MSYGESYGVNVDSLAWAPWYRLESFGRAVRDIRSIDFSIREQRTQALTTLAQLEADAPYNKDLRFPNEVYITEGRGLWGQNLTQIRNALGYKDGIKDHKDSRNNTAGPRGEGRAEQAAAAERIWDYNDANQAFWKSTNELVKLLGRHHEMYRRDNFERVYGLVWEKVGGSIPGRPMSVQDLLDSAHVLTDDVYVDLDNPGYRHTNRGNIRRPVLIENLPERYIPAVNVVYCYYWPNTDGDPNLIYAVDLVHNKVEETEWQILKFSRRGRSSLTSSPMTSRSVSIEKEGTHPPKEI